MLRQDPGMAGIFNNSLLALVGRTSLSVKNCIK